MNFGYWDKKTKPLEHLETPLEAQESEVEYSLRASETFHDGLKCKLTS